LIDINLVDNLLIDVALIATLHTLGHIMTSKACPVRYKALFQSSGSAAQTTKERVAATVAPAATGTTAVQALTGHTVADQIVAVQEFTNCIVVDQIVADQAAAVETRAAALAPELRYDGPRATYQRYVAVRDAWYKVQPRGSIRTNQQYPRALSLPLRYDKSSYQ
jgi:hypothetical protein